MSKVIMMALIMNLISLLFSTALARSDQNMSTLKSFKISENVTYDCIDIYKQPGLDHPLLKNHTIQMKPSVSIAESKSPTRYNETYKQKIKCPHGTVPIMRNSKEYNTKAKLFAEKYFHPLSTEKPGLHISGIKSQDGIFHGVEAVFNGYTLNIGKDQASYSQMYVGSGLNNQLNFISTGWMINPSHFGDGRVWKYGIWQGKNGKGCYNTACPGFVQVSNVVPIVEPVDLKPGVPGWSCMSIHQDEKTRNWWLTQLFAHAPNVDVGYWPKEIFDVLNDGANTVGFAGVVQVSPSGASPPMGNGQFPNKHREESATFAHVKVFNSDYKKREIKPFHREELLDSPKCYGLKYGFNKGIYLFSHPPLYFNYGGPGGNSCGI